MDIRKQHKEYAFKASTHCHSGHTKNESSSPQRLCKYFISQSIAIRQLSTFFLLLSVSLIMAHTKWLRYIRTCERNVDIIAFIYISIIFCLFPSRALSVFFLLSSFLSNFQYLFNFNYVSFHTSAWLFTSMLVLFFISLLLPKIGIDLNSPHFE